MMIRVRYRDDSTAMVRSPLLIQLIAKQKIKEFRREEGWVSVTSGAIRRGRVADYAGPERRFDNIYH